MMERFAVASVRGLSQKGRFQLSRHLSLAILITLILGSLDVCYSYESLTTIQELEADDQGDDIRCLREFKESVRDPLGYLHNWDFRGGRINVCNFVGVTCLHRDGTPTVNKLNLAAAGLGGRFPRGLSKCSSLTVLDLSNNFFRGRMPSITRLCSANRKLKELNLSDNAFTYANSESAPFGPVMCPRVNVNVLPQVEESQQQPQGAKNEEEKEEATLINVRVFSGSGVIPQ